MPAVRADGSDTDLINASAPIQQTAACLTTDVDGLRAQQTVPRERGEPVSNARPGVDLDVWTLHVRYERTRDPDVLAQLVQEYRRYALSLARRLYRDREPREDIDQIAMEALVVAIRRFDPGRGLPFPSYATPTILGSIRRHYRDHGWSVRVPRRVHEITVSARAAADRLTQCLGRPPMVAEVAREVGVSVEQLLEAEEAAYARETNSLDAPDSDDGGALGDQLGDDDPAMDLATDRETLHRSLAMLTERERELLGLYFFDELPQSVIAERYGVSQMQISRWLSIALRRLRSQMVIDSLPE